MSYAAFVPTDRLHALAAGRELPDRTRGAALFADLAGFTALAELLAQRLGSQLGAEELTRLLNGLYGVLVAEVERFGGSVVAFSGDAVTCWFDEGDVGRGSGVGDRGAEGAVLRAVACGLAMHQGLGALAPVAMPGGAPAKLAVKVAVAGGPARRFAIGDPALGLMDVLAGATIDLLSVVEHLAAPGEVLLDGATAWALERQLAVAEWRTYSATGTEAAVVAGLRAPVAPTPWPALATQVPDEVARRWMLPAVAERLRGGANVLLAELRRAVALFLSFGGIDYDDGGALAQLDRFVRRLQALADAYGGALLQLTVGDKGSYLYIAFGAPLAHHDAASNAVATARAALAAAAELGFVRDLRIGVAQGLMYCGAYGGPTRRTYGVLGDATNVAARLMGLAPPGQIRCDEEVQRAARRRWAFSELGETRLKGKSAQPRVFSPVAPIEAQAARGDGERQPLGRAAELARLEQLLKELGDGVGRVLAIVGEAGVGKSLLADTLLRMARASGVPALRGSGSSIERQTPYRAWRDLLEGFFELTPIEDNDARREQVRRAADALGFSARAPLLDDVLHLGLGESELTAALDARLRHESLVALLIALLRERLQAGPLLLLIEDVQWLDGLSWQLTAGVARALLGADAPLLLAIVHRPLAAGEPAAVQTAALHGLPRSETIALGGLDDEALVALAARRLGLPVGGLPAAVAALVRERAAGNPFFAEELVDNLTDRGLVAVRPGANGAPAGAVAAELAAGRAPLPETIEGLVLARIDRLPAEQQLLLKVAAVIGRSFGEPALYAAVRPYAAIERPTLVDYLVGLERRALTMLEAVEPELTYGFKHIITHDVAYETMLLGQRAAIHRAVAEWYEAAYAGRLEPFYGLLVHHYRRGGRPQREARYARLAGEQAAALFANEDAVAYLSRALELAAPGAPRERLALLFARERAYEVLGRREAQAADLRALEALAERIGDPALRAEAALRRARFAEYVSDFAAGMAAATRATQLAAEAGDLAGEADGRRAWGSLLYKQARHEEARAQLRLALELAERAGQPRVEASALHLLGAIASAQGDDRGAGALFQRALELYRAGGDRRGEAIELTSLGMIASYSGDYEGARTLGERSLGLFRAIGDRQGEAYALGNLGDDYVALGEYGAALACQEQALALFRAVGSWEGEGWALHNLGEALLTLGDYDGAQERYERALAIFQAIGSAEDESNARRFLGQIAHQRGDDASAAQAYQEALRIATVIGHARGRGYALTGLGNALAGLGRLDEADAAYREARALREAMAEPALVLETAAGQARAALARGDTGAALALVEPIIAQLATGDLQGADEPARIELTCYQTLLAAGDPRAPAALAAARARLSRRASLIADEGLRHGFLQHVPAHRALLADEV